MKAPDGLLVSLSEVFMLFYIFTSLSGLFLFVTHLLLVLTLDLYLVPLLEVLMSVVV